MTGWRAAAFVVCGSFIGLAHISGALGLHQPLPRLTATVVLIGILYRLWASLGGFWASAGAGLLTGAGYFGVAVHWLGSAANPDPATFIVGELWMAFGALWLFIPWWGVWFVLARALCPSSDPGGSASAYAFAGSFSVANLALGDFVMGIPMAPLSLVALDTPLASLFTVVGQFGVDLALIGAGTALGVMSLHGKALAPAVASILLAVSVLAPRPAPGVPPLDATAKAASSAHGAPVVWLAQPSLPHPSMMDPLAIDHTVKMSNRAQIAAGIASGASLVVLPEGAVLADMVAEPMEAQALAAMLPVGTSLLAGFPRVEAESTAEGLMVQPYNSAMLLNAAGPVAIYDKAHLVPFGETMPAVLFWLGFDVIAGPSGGLARGPGIRAFQRDPADSRSFALLICYEALLPGAVSREIGQADWLLNISSEALLRGTIGPAITLDQTRIRALETGRPILRSTAHAFSGLIGSDGAVRVILAPEVSGGVAVSIPPRQKTMFASFGPFAFAPLYLVTIFLILAAGVARLGIGLRISVKSLFFN